MDTWNKKHNERSIIIMPPETTGAQINRVISWKSYAAADEEVH